MDEKEKIKQEKKGRLRRIAVISFLLISGLCYSQAYYDNELAIGTPTTVDEARAAAKEEKITLINGIVDKVNLNTADEKELIRLPGVGEITAAAIVAYREQAGDFKTIADIKKVSGIGEKKFQKMKDYITVD